MTTPRSRFDALPSERRAQLLDPAEEEFARHGFADASLNRILAAAGMSKGQAYHYITDKGDLYAAVIERALERLRQRLELHPLAASSPHVFWQQLRQMILQLTSIFAEDERMAALARGMYHSDRTRNILSGTTNRVRKWIDELIIAGQSIQAIRTDLPRTLLGEVFFDSARAIDRWFGEHWDELTQEEALRLSDDAFDLIVAMASPTAPQPKPRKRSR